jgi:Clr5 domain
VSVVSFYSHFQELLIDTSFIYFGCWTVIMPRPPSGIAAHRDVITKKVVEGAPHKEIMQWLAERGIVCNIRTLKRSLQQWGVSSTQTIARSGRQQLVEAINDLCHRFDLDDSTISAILNAQELYTTPAQVKRIRLEQGWRHRNTSETAKDDAWQRTLDLCWKAVVEGPARSYGRGLMRAYLRQTYSFPATLNNVQGALQAINAELGKERRP